MQSCGSLFRTIPAGPAQASKPRWFASVSEEIELVFVVGGDLEIMF
jgi:hypothetical protein